MLSNNYSNLKNTPILAKSNNRKAELIGLVHVFGRHFKPRKIISNGIELFDIFYKKFANIHPKT